MIRHAPRPGIGFFNSPRVHFMRNLLAHAGKEGRRVVSAFVATAFAQDDAEAASVQWRLVADQLRPKVPKLAALMDEAEHDVLAYMAFPREHRQKLHSTNPIERLHAEIKRRTNVVGIFPNEDAVMGLRPQGSNPCLGIRRYRRKGRARFLSDEEIRRLSARLSAHANGRPQQVAVIRLLLLTGCRKGEILTLRWSDYREGHLLLRDSKTGPRTVWLSQPARDVLDGLDRTGQWVFPAAHGKGPRNKGWLERFWDTVRAEAGLTGVRLHDLRHTHASIALRQGETVLTIARLLGHRNTETTLKYTHLADKTVMDAAEIVGAALDA